MTIINGIKKIFKGKPSEEERRIQAQMEYRRQERNFQRYAEELDKAVARFKQMAYEAYKKNQTENALKCAAFTEKLVSTRNKVDSVLQRFEMLQAMKNLGDMMLQFMDSCSQMGCDLKQRINIQELTTGQLQMAEGLNKLDFLSEQMEEVFNSIDDSFGLNKVSDGAYADPAAAATLDGIIREFGAPAVADPVPEAPAPVTVPAQKPAEPASPEMSALYRKLGELQN